MLKLWRKLWRKSYKSAGLSSSELFNSLIFKDFDTAKAIIAEGSDVNASIEIGKGCLHVFSSVMKCEQVKWLLEHGADVNKKGDDGCTPLIDVCADTESLEKDKTEMARLLLEYGADVNSRGACQKTALHFAAERGDSELAQVLLDYGADVNAKRDNDQTPLHAAAVSNFVGTAETIRALLEYGADVFATDLNNGATPRDMAEKAYLDSNARILRDWARQLNENKIPPLKRPSYGYGMRNKAGVIPPALQGAEANAVVVKYLIMPDKDICRYLMTDKGLKEARSVLQGNFEPLAKRMPHHEAIRVYAHISRNLSPAEKASFEKGVKAVKEQNNLMIKKLKIRETER